MFEPETTYYAWAMLLLLGSIVAWATTFVMLPGNWIIIGLAALFVWLVPAGAGQGLTWQTVGVLAAIAVVGELVEMAAGAAGAAKQGASRRALVLAIVGTVIGSIFGAVVGVPVPVVGPILGALFGGALGAFAGAYLGETWKGRNAGESLAVGKGAMIGRLLGTLGKLAAGIVMLVVIGLEAFG